MDDLAHNADSARRSFVSGIRVRLSLSVLMPVAKFRSVMGQRNINLAMDGLPNGPPKNQTDTKAFCSNLIRPDTPSGCSLAPNRFKDFWRD
jgi:hypothetical protein